MLFQRNALVVHVFTGLWNQKLSPNILQTPYDFVQGNKLTNRKSKQKQKRPITRNPNAKAKMQQEGKTRLQKTT